MFLLTLIPLLFCKVDFFQGDFEETLPSERMLQAAAKTTENYQSDLNAGSTAAAGDTLVATDSAKAMTSAMTSSMAIPASMALTIPAMVIILLS